MAGQNFSEQGRQWLRDCSLVVSDQGGEGLELAALRVVFAVRKGDSETPNGALIRVYNLSAATMSRMEREFTRVTLQAGYRGNLGVIFEGNILQFRKGRENGVDSYMELLSADGDQAYNWAMINATLAAGSFPEDRIHQCMQAFQGKGVKRGRTGNARGNALPRAKVMYGPAKKYMRDEAENVDCSWSIQDGALTVVRKDGYLPGEAVTLTHETGLVGTPEQTNDGLRVRCLLNPRLRVNGRIRLNNASVGQAATGLRLAAMRAPNTDRDGLYRTIALEFRGDTRGRDWYADMVCIGMDDTSNTPLDMAAAFSNAESALRGAEAPSLPQTVSGLRTPYNPSDEWERDFENFVAGLDPATLSEKDRLLLCLPDIAKRVAQTKLLEDDRRGWEILEQMFHKWFSGPARRMTEENRDVLRKDPGVDPFWIHWDWVMSYLRARNAYAVFTLFGEDIENNIYNAASKQRLGELLRVEGKLGTGRREYFNHIVSEAQWPQWYEKYFNFCEVRAGLLPDGMNAALRKFTLRALAKGYVEPNGNGGHAICVTDCAVFADDIFQFAGSESYGFWNCEKGEISLSGSADTEVKNSDFEAFRKQHGHGQDFTVLSDLHIVEDFKRMHYDFA